MKKDLWKGLKARLEKTALGITSRKFRIYDIPESEGEIGYTASGQEIYLAPSHPIMDDLDEKHQVAFVEGVFVHELMHQLATDFKNYEYFINKLPRHERRIFQTIFNIMEDPAIEYQAPCYIGGRLLKSLSFSIMHCYKTAQAIDGEQRPFIQFIQALILYGDGGLLKGEFTSEEAKDAFYKVIPIFDKAITEPNGKKRIHYANQAFEETRPLWQEEADFEKMMEELAKSMASAGKGTKDSNDGPMDDIEKDDSAAGGFSEKKDKRRKFTFHKISEEEAEKMGLNTEKYTQPTSTSSSSLERGTGSGVNFDMRNSGDASQDYEGDGTISEEEYEISDADIEDIKSTIESCINSVKQEKKEATDNDKAPLDLPEMSQTYKGVSCKNIRINNPHPEALVDNYNTLRSSMQDGIGNLTNQLRRIFKNEAEEREYRNSGRVNVKRLSSGRMTPRVFDRRKSPSNRSDICVMLLIDESGSMHGPKTNCARSAAIGLAEVFGNLHIPMSVIGFTADINSSDVVHLHYMHWLNTANERIKLLNISSHANNFDGYSIRYATKLLLKRPEAHKILIVISDGQPAARYYRSGVEGVKDTSDAIKEATKKVDVIGVAVGNNDTEVLYEMYKNDFLHVGKIDDLYNQLAQKVKNKIKGW